MNRKNLLLGLFTFIILSSVDAQNDFWQSQLYGMPGPQIKVSSASSKESLVLKLRYLPNDDYKFNIFDGGGNQVLNERISNGYNKSFKLSLRIDELDEDEYYYSFVNSKGSILEIGKFSKSKKKNSSFEKEQLFGISGLHPSRDIDNRGPDFNHKPQVMMLPVVLYDIYGSEVFSVVVVKSTGRIFTAFDLAGKLSSGIYLIKGAGMPGASGKKMVII